MKSTILLALVLGVGATTAIHAQVAGAPAVSGRVFDDTTGCPLRGVRLSAAGTTVTTLTDVNGRYRLKGVPATPFTLEAVLAGYVSSSSTGVIAADTVLRVDFSLVRAPGDTTRNRPRYPVATCVLDRKDSGGV